MQLSTGDMVWILLSATLVLLMQAAFLCLETGLARRKNAINVAMKNATDLMITLLVFWAVGFGFIFGPSAGGMIGLGPFFPDLNTMAPADAAIFIFQSMFAVTTATIVSGAVSERMSYVSYGLVTLVVALCLYPLAGHWVWGGLLAAGQGWLGALGFVDFAGATVVHSVGGWIALAAVLIVGPRIGRFTDSGAQSIPASNLTRSLLGGLFFLIGWIGFNGGSELGLTDRVPAIITNTLLAAASGAITAYLIEKWMGDRATDNLVLSLNGLIAGLVAVTAGAHAVSTPAAVMIGAVGAVVMVVADGWMVRHRLDDTIAAVPVHLVAGIWGTLAVGLFGQPERLGTGLSRVEQIGVQLLGITAIGATTFVLAWLLLRGIDRIRPLRVEADDEVAGLNVSEHGERTDLIDLLTVMERQAGDADLSARVPVEPFTEVGLIARRYNAVMEAFETAVTQTRTMFRDMRDGVLTFDPRGRVMSVNPGAERLLALDPATAEGRHIDELFRPLVGDETARGLSARLRGGEIHEVSGMTAGERCHLELRPSQTGEGDGAFYTAILRDVTERRQVEEQLDRERELAQVTFESIVDAVIATDREGCVRFINENASALSGWSRDGVRGRFLCDLLQFEDDAARRDCAEVARFLLSEQRVLNGASSWAIIGADGHARTVRYTAAPTFDRRGGLVGGIVVLHDITEARAMEQQPSYQATHDALTGLLNRREFEARLAEAITLGRERGRQHLLCYIDLDQFKIVNDTCGHLASDELLRQISRVIGENLRAQDVFARLGGDEFGVILRDCTVEQGLTIAEAIREQVRVFRFPWKGRHFALGTSIGAVALDADCGDLQAVLGQADTACYASKDHGRNRAHLFRRDNAEFAERWGQMQWVSRIRSALDRDRLRLYFQPIVATMAPGAPATHHEIFVRILDDDDRLIPPGAFIPAAERYGLMAEIDEWVVRNTLAWLGDVHRLGLDTPLVCPINLSGESLDNAAFRDRIRSLLHDYQVPGESVCFEITEISTVSNFEAAREFIDGLT